MDTLKFLATGLAGSTALTGIHQALRHTKGAPRVDLLGEQAVRKIAGNKSNLSHNQAYYSALAGDIVTNSLYYSIIAQSKRPILTGVLLGAAAGAMAVFAPDILGLNKDYVRSDNRKMAMTAGYYTAAGLIAGVAAKLLQRRKE